MMGIFGEEQTAVIHLGLALALGLFIGLERERAGKHFGVRSFASVAVAGALAAQVSALVTALLLAFVAGLALLVNLQRLLREQELEPTTAVVLVLTALLGVLVGQGQTLVPVSIGVVTVALLTWKPELVAFSLGLPRAEVRAAVMLALFTFVVYPILPVGYVDPWHLLDLRAAWLIVILIAAIGFANYVLLRRYGSRGILYTGILGGLVNSTVTVAELARRVQGGKGLDPRIAFWGILLANGAMLLRNSLLLAIIAPATLPLVAVPLGAMLLATLAALVLAPRGERKEDTAEVRLTSPFTLRSVLRYGLVLITITLLADLAQRAIGDSGFYAVSLLGGVVSSASASASAATLAAAGKLQPATAAVGALLASMASTLTHVPIVWRSGQPGPRRVAAAHAAVVLAGLVGILLNLSWFGLP